MELSNRLKELAKEFILDDIPDKPLSPIDVFEEFLAIVRRYRDELAIREECGDDVKYLTIANQIEHDVQHLRRRIYEATNDDPTE